MHVCVSSIMFLHMRGFMCVCVCVHVCVGSMCVFVCACPETVSAVLELTFCSYCNHNHFTWMCVFVTVYTCVCVSTQSIDILL